jgi:hypothetical protein
MHAYTWLRFAAAAAAAVLLDSASSGVWVLEDLDHPTQPRLDTRHHNPLMTRSPSLAAAAAVDGAQVYVFGSKASWSRQCHSKVEVDPFVQVC